MVPAPWGICEPPVKHGTGGMGGAQEMELRSPCPPYPLPRTHSLAQNRYSANIQRMKGVWFIAYEVLDIHASLLKH